jgi:osmotically inducible lipoprotein OsmB
MNRKIALIGTICVGLVFGNGCSSAPGTASQQGAVVGGATGAAVGASVTKNRALGAIIGGAVGAAGGYVIGGKTGHLDKNKAEENAQSNPVTTEQASSAQTADVNGDGFVTLDEIVAMEKSGLNDDEMLRRVQATGLTFELNAEQRQYLSDHGVSVNVIDRLPQLNRGGVVAPAPSGGAVISK